MSASVQVGPAAKPGESRIRRSTTSPSALLSSPGDGVKVIPDVLARSAWLFPDNKAVGWRDIVKVHREEKEVSKTVQGKTVTETKSWEVFELSDYKYWTYAEFKLNVDTVATGLKRLGVSSKERFNIYSATKPAWQLLANACAKNGITFATAYDSLGKEGLTHSLAEPKAVGVFTNANLVPTLVSALVEAPTVRLVIYDGELDAAGTKAVESLSKDVKVCRLEEVLEMGRAAVEGGEAEGEEKVKPEDVACIMYTSGSTGPPKGVMLTHGNVVASVAAGKNQLGEILTPNESLIAYLPLAHILEFVIEFIALHQGMTLGYGTVKTLTSLSVRNCEGDLAAFRPTFMFGVPAVFENIRKGILAKVNAGGPVARSIFDWAVWLKQSRCGPVRKLVDLLIFDKIKAQLGGRLKYAFSGGASMSPHTQEFLTTCVVAVLQGYGLTESTGTAAVLPPQFARWGSVGMPVSSNEIKLVDVPEAGYFTRDGEERGEVWIRGNSVSPGYFQREELTREAFDDEGWFKTGDIGQFNADGTLSIIDRKKNLVKLLGGEYVALERLESVYRTCPLVNIVCVVADSAHSRPMAVVVPHEAHLKIEAKKVGVEASEVEDMVEDERVVDLVVKSLREVGKHGGLQPLEMVDSVVLTSDEWTAANGMLTAANKLQRRMVVARYEKEIARVYA